MLPTNSFSSNRFPSGKKSRGSPEVGPGSWDPTNAIVSQGGWEEEGVGETTKNQR